ncbi:uncharacterized protein LOC120077283 [Benincasa hispida]|uniref:uncharacterized protein LOC120077283 n=1 Tax=Benincasa hispida TaxID=102211 RepID=UPI00190074D8|nr:uncharacterized protein LOC120077283 [Benincasa hispida]
MLRGRLHKQIVETQDATSKEMEETKVGQVISKQKQETLGAPTFEGTTNPIDAKSLFVTVEKSFRVMRCPKDRKVALATFLFQQRAEDWWWIFESNRRVREEITWEEFDNAFHEQFYPQTFRDAKQNKFMDLMQGSLMVAEYEQKYIELSKYATSIIQGEDERCRRFEGGLQAEI